jgi:RecA/RadA recombinase
MQERRKRVLAISTGSKAVDAMLGGKILDGNVNIRNLSLAFAGGLMSQSITEGKLEPSRGAFV